MYAGPSDEASDGKRETERTARRERRGLTERLLRALARFNFIL